MDYSTGSHNTSPTPILASSSAALLPDQSSSTAASLPSRRLRSLIVAGGFALGIAVSSAGDVMQIASDIQKAINLAATLESAIASGDIVSCGGAAIIGGIVSVGFVKGCYKFLTRRE